MTSISSKMMTMMAAAKLAIKELHLFSEEPDLDPADTRRLIDGDTGHTQGSHRDVSHGRHLNRLARKARRQERLHRKH